MMWWHVFLPVSEWRRMSPLLDARVYFHGGLTAYPGLCNDYFCQWSSVRVYSDPQVWMKAMKYCITGDPAALLNQFDGPAFFNLMSPQEDQQLGGIIMKLLQEFVNAGALYAVFMQWYRRERSLEDEPAMEPANCELTPPY